MISNEDAGTDPVDAPVHRIGGGGWQGYVFPAFWLLYLAQTASGVAKYSHGLAQVAGYVVLAAFAVTYLVALQMGWGDRRRYLWAFIALTLALTAGECVFAHADALVYLVYVGVLVVSTQHRYWPVGVAVLAAAAAFVPPLVPGWGGAQWTLGVIVVLVSLAMFGFFHIILSNRALSQARAEVARLAAENERSRIARDLHDLLGHSLTTITVKAGLARRLGEHGDTERALAEITEVEQLSRRTLGDVRAAVSAQREVNLAGELATAREVLRAAAINAELPPTVADTDADLSELFGWIVREGVTNAVRHSRAQHVRITLGRRSIDIEDDGVGAGGTCGSGNGLRGLRERIEAAGGTLAVEPSRGFRLRVSVPAGGAPNASEPAAEPTTATSEVPA